MPASPTLAETFWRDLAAGLDPNPPGKSLGIERHLPELHPKQRIAFESSATELLYGGAAGGGKALDLRTPIPTPEGWKTLGEIQVGDRVFDELGHPCSVTAVSPILKDRPCYRVRFSDGEELVADACHQWWTFDLVEREALRRRSAGFRRRRRTSRPKRGTGKRPDLARRNQQTPTSALPPPRGSIRTTEELARTVLARGRLNHAVRVCPHLLCRQVELPVPPYTLGVWLGDGTRGEAGITTADPQIVEEIERDGFVVRKRKARLRYGVLGLIHGLRALGIDRVKRIPSLYLRASPSQRLALLQGLMDTDGTALPSGSCEFYTTSWELAVGARELLLSLGVKTVIREGRARLNGRDCGPKYRLKFTTAKPVFRLRRKLARIVQRERGTQDWRMVEAVEPIESVPVRCIEVDSRSRLYLAGRGMIPTHNSLLNRWASIVWCDRIPGLQVYLFRRTFPELWKNHMRGKNNFYELLAPWIRTGEIRVVGKEIRFLYNGSIVHLCHAQYEGDVIGYDGDEIHLLMIDEATTFTEYQYRYLRSRCRLGGLAIPEPWRRLFPRIVNSTNPGGVGHNAFKQMFQPMSRPWAVWETPPSEGGMRRQYIPALLEDNPSIEEEYQAKLEGMGDDALVRAKRRGDWDIVAGGMFDDVCRVPEGAERAPYLIEPFEIPRSWWIDRSYDHGESHPFAVLWWAESDGTEAVLADGRRRSFPRGSLFLVAEDYGWSGERNKGLRLTAKEIGLRVREKERELGLLGRVRPGPADDQVFVESNGHSVAGDMAALGVTWTAADKSPGTRVLGWQKVRELLKETRKERPENPGMWVFTHCTQWRETVPTLIRDERNRDDTAPGQEDHIGDATRYRVLGRRRRRGEPRKVVHG